MKKLNALEYLKETGVLIDFDNKLIIQNKKSVVMPTDLVGLLKARMKYLGKNSDLSLIFAYASILGFRLDLKTLNSLGIKDSFKKGHFLHVLTDYMFYNRCIECWSEDIYIDYDILDEKIIKKYNVSTLPYDAEKYAHSHHSNCELKILDIPMVDKFINEISDIKLNSVTLYHKKMNM